MHHAERRNAIVWLMRSPRYNLWLEIDFHCDAMWLWEIFLFFLKCYCEKYEHRRGIWAHNAERDRFQWHGFFRPIDNLITGFSCHLRTNHLIHLTRETTCQAGLAVKYWWLDLQSQPRMICIPCTAQVSLSLSGCNRLSQQNCCGQSGMRMKIDISKQHQSVTSGCAHG